MLLHVNCYTYNRIDTYKSYLQIQLNLVEIISTISNLIFFLTEMIY